MKILILGDVMGPSGVKAVKEKLKAMHKRVFACPGNCGNCLPNGAHACGSKSFDGVAIGIGIHA